MSLEALGLQLLRRMDPERAHGMALMALRLGLAGGSGPVTSPRLKTEIAGLALPNPIGLAAGFDKNAEALDPLGRTGFGFLEAGAATPRPQPGNPRPRLFRLAEDQAAINRFGFNNDGMDVIGQRLAAAKAAVPVGLNLGANKDAEDRAGDFARVLKQCGPHVDFATVNVSSPNTERLRELQGAEALRGILAGVLEARASLGRTLPVFVKIAPDLSDAELDEIARTAIEAGIDGIIATNTTLDRTGLQSRAASETGGLSGRPLFERSTRVLARLSQMTEGKMPLIGVGGVSSAKDALTKIEAGASAVQLYTGLVYHGLSLAKQIAEGLDALLEKRGFERVADAVGSDRARWL